MQVAAPTRRTLLAGLGASLALAMTVKPARAAESPDWGSMELLDASDRPFRLDQSPKAFTLVTLWANWCGVCMRELDTVANITPAIGASKLDVVLMSHPDDWTRNQAITAQRGLSLPTARPSGRNEPSMLQRALLSVDGTFYVPRSILFSRDRKQVVWSHVGGLDWRRSEVIDHVRQWTA